MSQPQRHRVCQTLIEFSVAILQAPAISGRHKVQRKGNVTNQWLGTVQTVSLMGSFKIHRAKRKEPQVCMRCPDHNNIMDNQSMGSIEITGAHHYSQATTEKAKITSNAISGGILRHGLEGRREMPGTSCTAQILERHEESPTWHRGAHSRPGGRTEMQNRRQMMPPFISGCYRTKTT